MTRSPMRLSAALALAAIPAFLVACSDSSTNSTSDSGSKVYVALGNSLTAGFQSGGLRADWQKASYPALIAKQMGITDFQLPLIDSPGVGSQRINGMAATPLFLDSALNPTALPLTAAPNLSNAVLGRPYNDLAVPGAFTWDVLHAYDSSSTKTSPLINNPFFNIVLRPSVFQNQTMLQEAVSLHPDIVTLFIGANDILGGITLGTVVPGVTVTPDSAYAAQMGQIIDTLLAQTHAHLFVANIPEITDIPFVTTVPDYIPDPKTFQPATTPPTPLLTAESNVKYVLLPALAQIAKGDGIPSAAGGTGTPLPANLTLTQGEVDIATQLTAAYNAHLQELAAAHADRVTVVDIHTLLAKLTAGQITGLNGKYYKFDAAGQTAFSLDGIHPNSRGYVEIANAYIDAINSALGTSYAHASASP